MSGAGSQHWSRVDAELNRIDEGKRMDVEALKKELWNAGRSYYLDPSQRAFDRCDLIAHTALDEVERLESRLREAEQSRQIVHDNIYAIAQYVGIPPEAATRLQGVLQMLSPEPPSSPVSSGEAD